MEDEIDLRKYIDVLLKHWKLIVIITGIAVIVAGLVSFLLPPVYEAKATVLVVAVDQNTLLELARSPRVAASVIDKMGDRLDPGERNTGRLVGMVQAEANGSFIEITVRNSNPQKAADIANSWMDAYVRYAADYYLSIQPSTQELKEQAAAALAVFQEKQEALAEFQESARIDEMASRIKDMELLYNVMQLREQVQKNSSQAIPPEVIKQAFDQYQAEAYTSLLAGTWIALEPRATTAVGLSDIDNLLSILEKKTGVGSQSPDQLLKAINSLKTNLEDAWLTKYELTNSKDTAWKSYLDAVNKITTAEISFKAAVPPVRLVEQTLPPDSPVRSHKWVNIGIALVLGLVVGVFAAFGVEYFRKAT